MCRKRSRTNHPAVPRRPRGSAPSGARREVGFSVVEVLIASALLLIIAVAILPLFTRAMESNTAGGRATIMSTYTAQDLEGNNQSTVDHPRWQLNAPGDLDLDPAVLELATEYWTDYPADHELGDELWQDDETLAGVTLFWDRWTKVRKYTFADISQGVVSVEGDRLVPRGHPELFDVPLTDDVGAEEKNVHLIEFRTTIKPHREVPLNFGDQMTIAHFRSF